MLKQYKVEKGEYDFSFDFGLHLGTNEETYKVIFSKECATPQPLDTEGDWSKLVGWSYGMHHKNSIRVGWRPSKADKGCIDLAFYAYHNGTRIVEHFASVLTDTLYKIEIEHDEEEKHVIISVRNGYSLVEKHFHYAGEVTPGYRLYPYYGGTHPAPADMSIYLKRM